jgi:hypothetical protein
MLLRERILSQLTFVRLFRAYRFHPGCPPQGVRIVFTDFPPSPFGRPLAAHPARARIAVACFSSRYCSVLRNINPPPIGSRERGDKYHRVMLVAPLTHPGEERLCFYFLKLLYRKNNLTCSNISCIIILSMLICPNILVL